MVCKNWEYMGINELLNHFGGGFNSDKARAYNLSQLAEIELKRRLGYLEYLVSEKENPPIGDMPTYKSIREVDRLEEALDEARNIFKYVREKEIPDVLGCCQWLEKYTD